MVNLNSKKILITGGSGFIGSNFVEYILENYSGMILLNIDKMGEGSREFLPDNRGNYYGHVDKDIRELHTSHVFNIHDCPDIGKYDYIFHFAAESHVDRSIKTPVDFISNNVIGMASLLEYVRLYQPQARVINISTDEVFGHLDYNDPSFTEESPLGPRSPYSASKASADLIASAYHITYGLDIITTRCCNNYGPWQHSEKFIPTVIQSIIEGKKIPVYGNGSNIREWIYVDDHNKSILEIAEIGASGKSYNIGSGIEKTNLQIIQDILGCMNLQGSLSEYIEYVDDRQGHDFRYSIESLYYNRSFDLSTYFDGLRKTIGHFVKYHRGRKI